MSDNKAQKVPFSPILIMEFIRQVTVARFLNSDTLDMAVQFKLAKEYYDEIKAFPLQAQTIHLNYDYDEKKEILNVKTDEALINRFKEQKSLVEIANKYEGQYAKRYESFIKVLE